MAMAVMVAVAVEEMSVVRPGEDVVAESTQMVMVLNLRITLKSVQSPTNHVTLLTFSKIPHSSTF